VAVAFVRSYSGGNSGATSVVTSASSPAGTPAAGNLLLAFVAYRTVTGVTVSASGWAAQTAVANGTVGGHTILSKMSNGAETAAMTFQLSANVKAAVYVLEFSGASETLKNVVAGAVNSSAVAAHTGSAVASPLSSDFIVFFDHNTVSDAATVSSNASATPTTGWTNLSAAASTGGSATTRNRAVASYQNGRTASTTPSITWSTTVTGTKQQLQVQNKFAPNTPTIAAESNITASGFRANWTAGAIDSSHDAPEAYLLDVATDSGFTSMVSGYNGLNVGNVLFKDATGLADNTAYWYRVRGTNVAGTTANTSGEAVTTATATPTARITSVTERTISKVSGKATSVVTFRTDYGIDAWRVRLNSTTESNGTAVDSGTTLAANTDQTATIDASAGALNLSAGEYSIQVWVQRNSTWYRDRPRYRYGFYRSEQLTLTQKQTAIAANQKWMVVQAFWDRLQATNGGALSTTELGNLRTQINDIYDNGGYVIFQIAMQYAPTWVATGAVRHTDQFGGTFTGTNEQNVYDYVFSATMRGYLDDLITKIFTTLDSGVPYINTAKIEAVQVGGGYSMELHFPPDGYDGSTLASIKYWGFSAPAQTGTGLVADQVVCPLPSYIPFGGSSNDTDDATWINWYEDAHTRYMLWWIKRFRDYLPSAEIFVLHPSWGVRTDRSLPTNKTDVTFRRELAAGTDWPRQVAAYSSLDRVYPWSTWMNDSRGTPWTNPSDAPPWEALRVLAATYGKAYYLMGEPAGGGNANTDMDRIFTDAVQGAMLNGYLGCIWVDYAGLVAGTTGTLANFTTRTTVTLPS